MKVLVLFLLSFSIFACPEFSFNSLNCVDSVDGNVFPIEQFAINGNTMSWTFNGQQSQSQLPYNTTDQFGYNEYAYCQGDKIVSEITYDGVTAISYIYVDNDGLKMDGEVINTECDPMTNQCIVGKTPSSIICR